MTSQQPASQQQLQDAIRQLTALNHQTRQALQQKAAPGSTVLTVSQVVETVELVRQVFPVLSEHQAQAFLHETERLAGVRKTPLVDALVPYIDENYVEVRPLIAKVSLSCGVLGRAALSTALERVNRARRSRGASEIATLDALIQIHRSKKQQEELEVESPVSEEQDISAVLEAYKAVTGHDVEETLIGGFSLREFNYLREIKAYIKQKNPRLANPLEESAENYYATAYALFEKAQAAGVGPITQERMWEEAQQRKLYPHTLFKPLDGRGGAKWGGMYENIKVENPAYRANPVQGPVALSRTRQLTLHGENLLNTYKQRESISKFGFDPRGKALESRDRDLQRVREELLSHEAKEGERPTWEMKVNPQDLGFEMEEYTVSQDTADHAYEQVLGGVKVGEVIEQIADFLERRNGGERPDEGTIGHMAP